MDGSNQESILQEGELQLVVIMAHEDGVRLFTQANSVGIIKIRTKLKSRE